MNKQKKTFRTGPISPQAWVAKKLMRVTIKRMLSAGMPVPVLRKSLGSNGPVRQLLRRWSGPRHQGKININHIAAEWAGNTDAPVTLLYLHGGAYIFGGRSTHRGLVGMICEAANARGLLIDYRLAPENPFPAALEDAESCYDWLIEQGHDPARIVIAGDSAGGGLSLALLLKLRDAGKPLPRCAVLLSPWTDLTGSGESVVTRQIAEDMLDGTKIWDAAALYHADTPPDHPLVSPLFAELAGLPPLLIQVGTDEILWDDALRFDKKARESGVDCELQVYDGMPHVFQIVGKFVPEAAQAIRKIGEFINRKTG
jgi:acetyl esterase/lipase